LRPSPFNMVIVVQELRRRDVLTTPIRRALRWWLLGTTRMLLISRQLHRGRQVTQRVGTLLGRQCTEERPMWRRNRHHHAVVGTAHLQGQIIARDLVIDLLAAVGTA